MYELCPYHRKENSDGFDGFKRTYYRSQTSPELRKCPNVPIERLRQLRDSPEFKYDIVKIDYKGKEFDGLSLGPNNITSRRLY